MPHEIADSDGESDFEKRDPLQATTPHDVAPASTTDTNDPINTNFSQFLSPTQRLSDFSPSQHAITTDRSTGSTEKLLRGMEAAQQALAGSSSTKQQSSNPGSSAVANMSPDQTRSKRSHTTMVGSSGRGMLDIEETGSRKKRAKTYGQQRTRLGSSQEATAVSHSSHALSAAGTDETPVEASFDDANLDSQEQSANAIDGLQQGLEQHDHDEQVALRERDRPRRVRSLLEATTAHNSYTMSTARSSMGSYESINISGRGGMDIGNPFGSATQVLREEEANQEEEPLANLMHRPDNAARPAEDDLGVTVEDDFMAECATSPDPSSRNAHSTNFDVLDDDEEEVRPNKRRKSNIAEEEETATGGNNGTQPVLLEDAQAPEPLTVGPPPKKRGRKPKNAAVAASSNVTADDHDELNSEGAFIGMPKDQYIPRPSRSRAGTADPASQTSQASQLSDINGPSMRKREKSAPVGPQKGGTKTDQAAESSPVKLPTSELNLSDEVAIGLPKENYKPRPSRSRTKIVADDEDELSFKTPRKPEVEPPDETPKPTNTSTKAGRKGKKSKVKRAKTSAAALLKKAEPMLSDGEEDVVWMDTKPAKIKLDLPPEISPSKVKDELAEEDKPEAEFEDHKGKKSSSSKSTTSKQTPSKITIEIPSAPPLELEAEAEAEPQITAAAPEPKKRGRKRKKATEATIEAAQEDAQEDAEETAPTTEAQAKSSSQPTNRSPLTELDTNTTSNPPQAPDKRPTLSPITPPKPGPSLSTPVPTSPTKSSSGPTQHSPIKSIAKSRYRIGLSKRQSLPSLHSKINRNVRPPTIVTRTEKVRKVAGVNDGGDGEDGGVNDSVPSRDKNGQLMEFDW